MDRLGLNLWRLALCLVSAQAAVFVVSENSWSNPDSRLTLASPPAPSPSAVPISRFYEVSEGIYRGARPDQAGLKALIELGVHTDLDIDDDKTSNIVEQTQAEKLGLRFVAVPLSGFWAPKDKDVATILATLSDARNYPIFIHCQHGEDRTGLLVGLYRVEQTKWSPAEAYQEMLTDGFHRELVFLDSYFHDKAGL